MAESIRFITTSTIQAPSYNNDNNSDSTQKIHLTPWDLQWLPTETIQKGLLFHNPINAKSTTTQIEHLKHSLSSTLSFFPPLAGRFIIAEHQDNIVSCFISCNNAGALFVHAEAPNTTVADILQSNYVPRIVHSFFALNGVKNHQGTSQPLLAVQVTELVDGIFIACTINHVVADGKSFWHFINSWAEISRGCDKLSKPPSLQRWFPDDIDLPIRFPFTKETESFKQPKPTPERVFHFTKEKIAQLKSKANAEANSLKISSLQALLTHLWRVVIRSKSLDPQQEVPYLLLIDARPRMVPPLSESYFGTAAMIGAVTMNVGELLLEGGFGKGAKEMNKMISLHNGQMVRSEYEYWVRNPKQLKLSSVFGENALATSSSPRFNVYGNDFGWGKPVTVRSGGANKRSGKITMFEGVEEGSIDIEVCLPYEILEAMVNDPEFIGANAICI